MIGFALLIAAQVSQTPYQQHNCDAPMTQMDMNACAALEFEEADAELNRIWPGVIASAREQDREISEYDQRPTAERVVREAQRAWITFRDAHCTYEAYGEARGGSMEPMVYSGCLTNLTRDRIRQLTGADRPQPEQ